MGVEERRCPPGSYSVKSACLCANVVVAMPRDVTASPPTPLPCGKFTIHRSVPMLSVPMIAETPFCSPESTRNHTPSEAQRISRTRSLCHGATFERENIFVGAKSTLSTMLPPREAASVAAEIPNIKRTHRFAMINSLNNPQIRHHLP